MSRRPATGRVRLVATDLDNTLLRSDRSVSPRTRAALDAVRAAGITVVPVTARQPIGLRLIAQQAAFRDWALCGNGALALHLTTGEVLFEHTVPVAAQQALAAALTSVVPGVRFAAVREKGEVFVAGAGYPALADYEDHKRHPADMVEHTLADVLAAPSQKVVLRHPEMGVAELVAAVRGLALPGFGITQSGAPFAEVLPPGVDKSVGLSALCAHLGIAAGEVIAFGDAENDREMLEWAGHGVAVANAVPETLATADEVAASNEEDGVAIVLERVLATRSVF